MNADKNQNLDLSTPVRYCKGVGPAKAKIFSQLGVETVGDLFEYYPRDWEFIEPPAKINSLVPGVNACVIGLVESVDFNRFSRARIFEVILTDQTASLRVVWFGGDYLVKKIEPGMAMLVWGKTSVYKHNLQMANPKFKILTDNSFDSVDKLGGGIYPATAKLSSAQIKRIISALIDNIDNLVEDFFNENLRKHAGVIERSKALKWIHTPADQDQLCKAKRRLKYEELFLMQLGLALRRYRYEHFSKASAMKVTDKMDSRIRKRFPLILFVICKNLNR